MRLGIDVGGTNTDAVLINGNNIIASTKEATSGDIASGVINAITTVISQAGVSASDLEAVMIGTTQFTNAFVERRCLDEIAVVRICLPASQALQPLEDWPEDLKEKVGLHTYLTAGGYEYDGREIAPLDEGDIALIAADLKRKGIKAVAISSVFAPICSDMEERAAMIIRKEIPEVSITLSSHIGTLGLLERENAAAMNACLLTHANKVVGSFRDALRELNITAPFFMTQNDGTLMNADTVLNFPILTFSSGPTNSMRGAAWLSGVDDALVVDIGGTTCDVGALVKGFPRESAISVDIGGVRTNFRMPDIISVGLGGGSLVDPQHGETVGPQSVGYKLTEQALVFGGSTLTATDIAVAIGQAEVGDAKLVSKLDQTLVSRAMERITEMAEEAIDRMKTVEGNASVILVGGGSILIGNALQGTDKLLRPEHFAVANAIGAAIAQVGGEVDRVYGYAETPRQEALADAQNLAIEEAVSAGALRETITIVNVEEMPLAYLPNGAVRIRVKAVGDLNANIN